MAIRATVTGNLPRAPELKQTRNGKNYLTFSIGSNEKQQDGTVLTTWIRCTVFESTKGPNPSEWAGRLDKGSAVKAEGTLQLKEFTNKAGEVKQSLELVVWELQGNSYHKNQAGIVAEEEQTNMDDIPF